VKLLKYQINRPNSDTYARNYERSELMVFTFLEGLFRSFFGLLPIGLVLLVFPDIAKRNKKLKIGDEEIPIYDTTLPEERHPNFNLWFTLALVIGLGSLQPNSAFNSYKLNTYSSIYVLTKVAEA